MKSERGSRPASVWRRREKIDLLGPKHHVPNGQDDSDHHDGGPHQVPQWARGLHLQKSLHLIQYTQISLRTSDKIWKCKKNPNPRD